MSAVAYRRLDDDVKLETEGFVPLLDINPRII